MKYSRNDKGKGDSITLPNPSEIQEECFEEMLALMEANRVGPNSGRFEIVKMDAYCCSKFVRKWGEWGIESDQEAFEKTLMDKKQKTDVLLANWLYKVWGMYTGEVMNPPVYASN